MAAIIMDGRKVKEQMLSRLREHVPAKLAIINVGDDPASAVYVRNKTRACEQVGIETALHSFPYEATQEDIESLIDELNVAPDIDGILIQLPLPAHIDEWRALRRINPAKDVDGLTPHNTGRLVLDGDPFLVPCTPEGICHLMAAYNIPVSGKHCVIVGRSAIVGKPMALMMLNANATVTVCHSYTKNLPEITRQADILIVAVGKPKMITADMVKPGAAVIDVGINRVDGQLVGDVDFDAVKDVAGWITPVPGGVGQMTVTSLLINTRAAADMRKILKQMAEEEENT